MKKRTVWMLTLMCLVAVISVYYVFERPSGFDLTTLFTDESLDETILTGTDLGTVKTDNHLFDEMRLELSNERSQLREQYTQKIASDQASAEEKSTAYTEMNALIERESAESMLEMLIQALGYADVLVRIDGEKASVTVMSDEMSTEQANEIVYIVKSELSPTIQVLVDIQSEYY